MNRGVTVYGAGSAITGSIGSGGISGVGVSVTGTAGTQGTGFGIGVSVLYGGKISDGGSGTLVTGTGGGSGGANQGVEIGGAVSGATPVSTITSTSGVSVIATSGPGASVGLYLSDAATIGSTPAVSINADSISFNDTASSITATGANTGIFIQTIAATHINLGGANAADTLGLTTAELSQLKTPALGFSDVANGDITISQPITRTSKTDLFLDAGTGGLSATASGTDLNLDGGTLFFEVGTFGMPIAGLTADTNFPQLHVNGGVNIGGNGGVTLNLAGTTYAGKAGDAFTIIKNDGGNAISGTFQNLPEGATFPWPASSLITTITYKGGSGHDVVLTLSAPGPAGTTTAVTSSMNPSDFGHSITFTATVSVNAPGTGTPTGMVSFLDGTNQIGLGTVNGSGIASISTSALTVGNHTITASYSGDSNFAASSGALSGNPQVVFTADTTTTVTSSMNPSDFGHSVTFTISVNPSGMGVPSGMVNLLEGSSTIASGTLDGNGMASLSTSALAVGNHTITASYVGDGNFNGSTGTLSNNPQMVFTADTITTVTSSSNPSTVAQGVMLTATVAPAPGGSGTPTGNVVFDFGDGAQSSPIALTGGVAQVDHSFAASGTFTVTATYSGDANFSMSSNTVSGGQVVNANGGAYASNPAPGSTLDFGGVGFVFGAPPVFPIRRTCLWISSTRVAPVFRSTRFLWQGIPVI